MKLIVLLLPILVVSILECKMPAPANFWEKYETAALVKNIQDHGPYGGHRAMYWRSKRTFLFDSGKVIEFAAENGWTLIDSLRFVKEQTDKWEYSGLPVFPLTFKGFSNTSLKDGVSSDFPRWFDGNLAVYRFKTGWVIVEPGSDEVAEVNGFAVLSEDSTKLAVYHLWGD